MISLIAQYKFVYFTIFVFVSFYHETHGLPKENLRSVSEQRNGKFENVQRLKNSSVSVASVRVSEGRQRFCLSRLRSALRIVCSGPGGPRYFNPGEVRSLEDPSKNQTEVKERRRSARNEKFHTFESGMFQTQRRLLRGRSRRNIVRECCDKPCSYSDLRKYCSPPRKATSSQISHPINSAASELHNQETNHVTVLQDQPSCFGNADCDQRKVLVSQQCVTIADLQRFYEKLLQKQLEKGHQKTSLMSPDRRHNAPPKVNETENELPATNALAVATNQLITDPKNFLIKLNSILDSHTPRQVTTTELPDVDIEESNEITENEGNKYDIMRAPPIDTVFNFPRGTNDYLY